MVLSLAGPPNLYKVGLLQRGNVVQVSPSPSRVDREFSELYGRELSLLVKRAYLILGSTDDASEVVQEAFTKLYERWDEVDDPAPYLSRMVLNACRDRGRRTSRTSRLLHRLPRPEPVQMSDRLDDVLDRLPVNQRCAVVLRYFEDRTTAEIAQMMDVPEGSVGPWISRALATMRRALR